MEDGKLLETKKSTEKAILVAVDIDNGIDVEKSLDELGELAKTAGAEVVGKVKQARESFHPGTYIGKGKIEEVAELAAFNDAELVICDDELSPAQMSNLADALGMKVIDRTVLILDIFAAHARTAEGKLQVELAQLRYRSSHLIGMGKVLSRLGGGIGTRGPGETKLESDRRLIRSRISTLNKKLAEVVKNREIMRAGREGMSVVAIVGYTNAGKSTLLNTLTDADVLSEDKLFATLDTTTRALVLDSGRKLLFTDTVGFINKLPHALIKAFRSTLEEAVYADMILHVVDVSNPDYEDQMRVVYETLDELGVKGKPVLTAFNKIDKSDESDYDTTTDTGQLSSSAADGSTEHMSLPAAESNTSEGDGFTGHNKLAYIRDSRSDDHVFISAKTGEGTDELLVHVEDLLNSGMIEIEKKLRFDQAGLIQKLRTQGQLISEEYTETGILVKARIPSSEVWILGE